MSILPTWHANMANSGEKRCGTHSSVSHSPSSSPRSQPSSSRARCRPAPPLFSTAWPPPPHQRQRRLATDHRRAPPHQSASTHARHQFPLSLAAGSAAASSPPSSPPTAPTPALAHPAALRLCYHCHRHHQGSGSTARARRLGPWHRLQGSVGREVAPTLMRRRQPRGVKEGRRRRAHDNGVANAGEK